MGLRQRTGRLTHRSIGSWAHGAGSLRMHHSRSLNNRKRDRLDRPEVRESSDVLGYGVATHGRAGPVAPSCHRGPIASGTSRPISFSTSSPTLT